MDKVVHHIRTAKRDEKGLQQLQNFLQNHDSEIVKQRDAARTALSAVDPQKQSLGYLYLLDAAADYKDLSEEYFTAVSDFLSTCTAEQVRLAPKKLYSICAKMEECASAANQSKAAIQPLIVAINILATSPSVITAVHALLFKACALAKCYSAAAPFLVEDASDVDPSITGLTATTFLLYCYYGARIHIGRRKYAEALQLLLQAITAPTNVVNAITMAAYKKYVLVSLIHTGDLPNLPKFTPTVVVRGTKSECTAYLDIAQAYKQEPAKLRVAVEKSAQTFTADGNWGLLTLALEARTKRDIQRLTKTYLTMTLQQITASVEGLKSASDAEMQILRMINEGEISAQIDEANNLVRFQEDTSGYEDSALMSRLESQLEQCIKVADKLKSLDHQIACEKAYASKSDLAASAMG